MIVVAKSNIIALWATILMAGPGSAQDADLAALLKKPILAPRQTLAETQSFCEKRVPRVPEFKEPAAWTTFVKKTRADVLAHVVYRGEATQWRDYQGKV